MTGRCSTRRFRDCSALATPARGCSRACSSRHAIIGAQRHASGIACALLAAASIVLAACSQLKSVERRASQDLDSVTATLPVEPRLVQEAIAAAFAGDRRRLPEMLQRFSVARPGDDYFPRDDQLAHERGSRAALARYLAAPATARREDLFLYDFSDADDEKDYWPSEYYVDGRQVPFRCNFLIHLEPSGAAATAIEIFELSPRVWVGEKFSFEAHGPGLYLDVRDVAPTTADRLELLQVVRQLMAK